MRAGATTDRMRALQTTRSEEVVEVVKSTVAGQNLIQHCCNDCLILFALRASHVWHMWHRTPNSEKRLIVQLYAPIWRYWTNVSMKDRKSEIRG